MTFTVEHKGMDKPLKDKGLAKKGMEAVASDKKSKGIAPGMSGKPIARKKGIDGPPIC